MLSQNPTVLKALLLSMEMYVISNDTLSPGYDDTATGITS